MADKPIAVGYARYSSDMQREDSIEAQTRAIKQFAEQKGYVLQKVYSDRGISGTTDNRPAFLRMIENAKTGIDAVIVHKSDRFARNRYDAAIYRKALEKCGVKLISVLENFDDDSPESVILQSVIEGYNEIRLR